MKRSGSASLVAAVLFTGLFFVFACGCGGGGDSAEPSVALADLDGDGDLDLVTGNNGPNLVWENMGAGIFTDTGQSLGSSNTGSVVLGDADGDGEPDIVAGNRDGQTKSISTSTDSETIGAVA